jgi:hypothetical protein
MNKALLAPILCAAALFAAPASALAQATTGAPVYTSAPDLGVTASLAAVGGSAQGFSIQQALIAMLGPTAVQQEFDKLTRVYGQKAVADWMTVFNFAVTDGDAAAAAGGMTLPQPPAELQGPNLAVALVIDGDENGTFWSTTLLDHIFSHTVAGQVEAHVDQRFGPGEDANFQRITDQAMYDLAQSLDLTQVQLAAYH